MKKNYGKINKNKRKDKLMNKAQVNWMVGLKIH